MGFLVAGCRIRRCNVQGLGLGNWDPFGDLGFGGIRTLSFVTLGTYIHGVRNAFWVLVVDETRVAILTALYTQSHDPPRGPQPPKSQSPEKILTEPVDLKEPLTEPHWGLGFRGPILLRSQHNLTRR